MFSGCTVPPDNKETELKNAACGGVDIPEIPGYHLLRQIEFSVKVAKITSRVGFS